MTLLRNEERLSEGFTEAALGTSPSPNSARLAHGLRSAIVVDPYFKALGSGGVMALERTRPIASTGGYSIVLAIADAPENWWSSDDTELPSQKVARIRAALGINIKETAAVLRVERPTIYAWLRDRWDPQETNRERLQQVSRLARRWTTHARNKLGPLFDAWPEARARAMPLLIAADINEGALVELFSRAASAAQDRRTKQEGARTQMNERVLARAKASSEGQTRQDEFDLVTGKRFGPE
jgi:transcriptional regulator with XRE-family HTH domain